MNINNIISVSISRQTKVAQAQGFGVPLIAGPNGPNAADVISTYSSLSAFAADYATSTDEYKAAAAIFGQSPAPTSVKACKLQTTVAQVITMTPTPADNTAFTVTINGTLYSFTSGSGATAGQIVTGLKNLITADPACVVTPSGTTTLILTAQSAGLPFTYANSANIAAVVTAACVGIANDLAVLVLDTTWYMLHTAANDAVTVMQAAATIETMNRMYMVHLSDSAVITSSTTDLASKLSAAKYTRTACTWHGVSGEYFAAALMGVCLPLTPGSETWAFKTCTGITADSLNDTQVGYLKDKNCNFYVSVAGLNVSMQGMVASGEYIDVMRGVDWLTSIIQSDIFTAIVNLPKVPLTNAGISALQSIMEKDLNRAIGVGLLQSYTASAPKASDLSANDKAARQIGGGGLQFVGQLAGAVQNVSVVGVVTL